MSAEVIRQVEAEGIALFLADGAVRCRGKADAIRRWLPTIREHKAEILAALTVPAGRVVSFEAEARRRGLIRFRLRGDDGQPLPGFSLEMPRPGETRDQCLNRLRAELGADRLIEE